MTATFHAWCVVATDTGIEARELPYERLSTPAVLAIHADKRAAEQAVNRAILLQESMDDQYGHILERERDIRATLAPGEVQARINSIAHEITVRNKLLAAVREIVQPRALAD